MMQFLACLHILLTCSFVLLLAYILSTFFSYLASSIIHGGSAKARKRGVGSGRPPNVEVEQELLKADFVMDRLPEEDEEDGDIYENAEMPAAAIAQTREFEFADGIFDNRIAEGLRSNEYSGQTNDGIAEENMEGRGKLNREGASGRWHDDEEGKMGNGELELEADNGGKYRDAEYRKTKNASSWDKKEGEAVVKESSSSGSSNSSSSNKLVDAQGSSSLQQRLPPTWSDLEKMVKMNSNKNLLASTEPALLEQY